MKAVILAGGRGTRISEESQVRPKPMVEIGPQPIIWHIMKLYSAYGINDFVVCLGYKGYVFKEYFANYYLHTCDVTFDIANNTTEVHRSSAEAWRVTLVDTGLSTMTGGRLRRVLDYVGDEDFCFTYGDGLSNVDIGALIAFHRAEGATATVTAVRPPGRFGRMELDGHRVQRFVEKPSGDGAWISGGFFVLTPAVAKYLGAGDDCVFEAEPLQRLAGDGELASYRHTGFWQPMDTVRDRDYLEQLWATGTPPWVPGSQTPLP
jgi:glucose-1-phosphate cytidylyltransferase